MATGLQRDWSFFSEGKQMNARVIPRRPIRSEYNADWTYAEALEDYSIGLRRALEAIVEAGRMSDQSRARYCAEIASNALTDSIAGEIGPIDNAANIVKRTK